MFRIDVVLELLYAKRVPLAMPIPAAGSSKRRQINARSGQALSEPDAAFVAKRRRSVALSARRILGRRVI
jgi:hypothetical protein